jgi:TFA2 Winged helix domain 2/TFIIE beta subunit core domain
MNSLKQKQLKVIDQMASFGGMPSATRGSLSDTKSSSSSASTKSRKRPRNEAPIGTQIFEVVAFLRQLERVASRTEIERACNVDLSDGSALMERLSSNPKLLVQDGQFSYRAKYELTGIDELYDCIAGQPSGMLVADIEDAYANVVRDVYQLADEGKVFLLQNSDSKQHVVYPLVGAEVRASLDIRKLWGSIQLPDNFEIQQTLREANLTYEQECEHLERANRTLASSSSNGTSSPSSSSSSSSSVDRQRSQARAKARRRRMTGRRRH